MQNHRSNCQIGKITLKRRSKDSLRCCLLASMTNKILANII
uniref:Uncharacterized protein n=1 Tax=Arundo donax TaxID=35708 RepID=A0A0A9FBB0_ARUDO